MKIVLLQNVKNIGQAGDIKEVAEGYARNFLIPRKMAETATAEAIKKAEIIRATRETEEKTHISKLQKLAEKTNGQKIVIKVKAKAEKLFGSVTAKDIANELKNRHLEIDEKYIILEEPIKQTGSYKINIDFGRQIKSQIEITVEGIK